MSWKALIIIVVIIIVVDDVVIIIMFIIIIIIITVIITIILIIIIIIITHQSLLAMLESVTASSRFTAAQLTLSTPPQMPQLLTDTDSLRLVPIVATCSVTQTAPMHIHTGR